MQTSRLYKVQNEMYLDYHLVRFRPLSLVLLGLLVIFLDVLHGGRVILASLPTLTILSK